MTSVTNYYMVPIIALNRTIFNTNTKYFYFLFLFYLFY